MNSEISELHIIYNDLRSGKTATPVTIRKFLSWFGVQRRTRYNVEYINQEMSKCDIQTVPSYLNIWVETPITFELISEKGKRDETYIDQVSDADPASGVQSETAQESIMSADPAFRVGKLKAATRVPTHVKPNDPIGRAMTIMMTRNFSQLPVMTTDREVKGVISWSSIGERYATGATGSEAQHFMDDHQEISISTSLFIATRLISEHNYVLVRDQTNKISGIVTANDIASEFEETSTPFLLLSEIENHLRGLLNNKVTVDEVRNTCSAEHLPRDFVKISDLTFGNYVYILDHIDNWSKIGLRLDKTAFVSEIREVNEIRNNVMHFDSDSIQEGDLTKLRDVSRLLDTLRRISK